MHVNSKQAAGKEEGHLENISWYIFVWKGKESEFVLEFDVLLFLSLLMLQESKHRRSCCSWRIHVHCRLAGASWKIWKDIMNIGHADSPTCKSSCKHPSSPSQGLEHMKHPIFFRSDMQFMLNYVSSSFPSAEWRNKMKKENNRKEQENLWLQDKLLTSTYNTGPDGFV